MDSIDRAAVYPQVYLAGETWGISGSAFLWVYVPMALLAVAIGFRLRWNATRAPVEPPAEQLTAPELGMLFGDERAVMAAIALLRSYDLVDSTGAAAPDAADREPAGLDPSLRIRLAIWSRSSARVIAFRILSFLKNGFFWFNRI